MSWLLFVLGILLFIFLIIIHEFGHFVVARRNGVKPEEFGIFFPPRLWSKRMPSGYVFSINLLPLGGFVRLKGEHDADTGPGTYGAASLWVKLKILLAGVGMNVLAAFVIFTVLGFIGLPQIITKQTVGQNQFSIASNTKVAKNEVLAGYVEPGSPAQRVGIKSSDVLVSIKKVNGQNINIYNSNSLPGVTKELAGQKVVIDIKRQGQIIQLATTLRTTQVVEQHNNSAACTQNYNCYGYLGISPVDYTLTRSTWSAPVTGAGLIGQITWLTLKGIGNALSGLFQGNTAKATSQLTGPVGIVIILKEGTLLGYQFILFLVGLISISLAILNALPIPALDGGRLFFSFLPRILIRKPLKQRTEELINGFGFALLILLFILITIADIKRF